MRSLFAATVIIALIVPIAAQAGVPVDPTTPPDFASETTVVNLQTSIEMYERSGRMLLPMPGGGARLADVTELQVFAKGQAFVEHEVVPGVWGKLEDVNTRSFVGKLSDEAQSSVHLTMDLKKGHLLAYVVRGNVGYTISAVDLVKGIGLAQIEWTSDHSTRLSSQHGHSEPSVEVVALGSSSVRNMQVKPDVDFRVKQQDSMYTTRIAQSLSVQHAMWDSDVAIHMEAMAIRVMSVAWSDTHCSDALLKYRNWLDTHLVSGGDAYVLYHGADVHWDGGSEVVGCAAVGALGPSWGGAASSLVEVLNVHTGSTEDYYNPFSGNELGLVAGQEIGHNAGEGDHPSGQRCEEHVGSTCIDWSDNIMANAYIPDHNFWFLIASQDKIEKFAYNEL